MTCFSVGMMTTCFARYRVRTGPGNPGKSLNLKNKNPGLVSPGILLKVLESPGIFNSVKIVFANNNN